MEELNMKDLVYKDKSGGVIKNSNQYFSNLENELFVAEKLDVGDIVKLRNFDDKIEVTNVDYEIPNVGIVDYAGKNLDHESNNLIIFNQKDIELYEKRKSYGK